MNARAASTQHLCSCLLPARSLMPGCGCCIAKTNQHHQQHRLNVFLPALKLLSLSLYKIFCYTPHVSHINNFTIVCLAHGCLFRFRLFSHQQPPLNGHANTLSLRCNLCINSLHFLLIARKINAQSNLFQVILDIMHFNSHE